LCHGLANLREFQPLHHFFDLVVRRIITEKTAFSVPHAFKPARTVDRFRSIASFPCSPSSPGAKDGLSAKLSPSLQLSGLCA